MKDDTQSEALIESRTLGLSVAREIETLEIIQPDMSFRNSDIDIAFLIDVTGSMSSRISVLNTALPSIAATLQAEFSGVKFALVTFKDEDAITFPSANQFLELEDFQPLVSALTSGGGGDTAEAGYHAITRASQELEWRNEAGVYKSLIVISDAQTHSRGSTLQNAIDALAAIDARLYHCDTFVRASYTSVVAPSGGSYIEYSSTASILGGRIVAALLELETFTGKDPIFLCNDNAPFTALDEEGTEVTYLPRGFNIGVAVDGTDGSKGINLTVDNSDLEVSNYLADAIKNNLPIEVVYRLYLSDVTSGPQTNPPLRVYLSDVEVAGTTVSAALGWVNLVDAPFPNEYYTNSRFPAL